MNFLLCYLVILIRKEGFLLEEILIKLAQKGDKKSLEKLLQNNYPIVKGYLIKMTFNESTADDITQETMVKAIININKFEPRGKFSSWLITIANNLYRDQLRKNKRVVYMEDDENRQDTVNLEDTVVNKMEWEKLKSILEKLPQEKRMVFILKHYHGYSYEEISDIMKCPIGTVRSRLHYCINQVKLQMKGVSEDE